MFSKFLKIVLFSTLILSTLINAKIEYITFRDIDVQSPTCYNPNQHLGHCVSVYECASLRYVLTHKLRLFYEFIRASECPNGRGEPPFVCCTQDINFKEQNHLKNNADRIIFPDEIDRIKRMDEEIEVMKNGTFLDTNSSLIADNEISTKFPKPPHCGGITISNKIYGGKDAELGEFSWMVILEYRNLTSNELTMDCSGSIINEQYVLTAAHCVQGDILKINGKLESVRIGEHNTETETDCNEIHCRSPYQRIKIHSIIPHPDYRMKGIYGTRNQHDIALLRLEKPIKLDENLQAICLPSVQAPIQKNHDENTKLTVAGWGHNGTSIRTAIKQKVELPFVKQSDCRHLYSKKFYLADEQFCAGGRFREDSCNGDSGGPIMSLCNDFWILEGIVSFGFGCGLEKPGVYTNVNHYLQWIDDNVKN